MNGVLFEDLYFLSRVYLNGNICVDEFFIIDKLERISKIIDDKCGFLEASEEDETIDQPVTKEPEEVPESLVYRPYRTWQQWIEFFGNGVKH